MKKFKTQIFSGLVLSLSMLLISCGSSSSGGGTGKAVVTAGVMTKGSVKVNGVTFTATGAAIKIDDNPNRPEIELEDGMLVAVKGRINDDGVTGVAEKIEAEDELEGPITSIDSLTGKIVIFAHDIFVDDATVFGNIIGGLAGIQVGDIVEVHGFVDADGRIRATRLEKKTLIEREDEIKGVVTNKTASTFNIGSLVIAFDNNTVIVGGTTFNNNDFVEVHLDGTLKATRIELEDVEDAEFEPGENEEVELEGFVSGFTAHPGTFKVKNMPVTTNSSTRFEGGSSLDLADNVKVEAEGNIANGVLIAEKIKFKRVRILIQGIATAKNTTSGEITLLGKVVHTDGLTRFDDSLASIVENVDRVEIRGFVDNSNKIIAERVKKVQGNDKDVLQAPVEVENVTGKTVTLLGITANLSTAEEFRNDNEQLITMNDFFGTVVAASGSTPGTLVKVKGTFDAGTGTITVKEAELED